MPWFDGLEAADVGHIQNRGWDKLDGDAAAKEAYKSFRSAESKLGLPEDRVLKLPEKLDGDEMAPIWNRLGVPATADKYDFSSLKGANGAPLDEPTVAVLRDLALTGGMTQGKALKAAEKFLADRGTFATTTTEAQAKAAADAETAKLAASVQTRGANVANLQGKWLQSYDVNVLAAQRMANQLGYSAADLEALSSDPKYPQFMERFLAMAQGSGEMRLEGHKENSNPADPMNGFTEQQLEARKQELFAENRDKMMNPDKAAKIFKEMSQIDARLVALRYQRR